MHVISSEEKQIAEFARPEWVKAGELAGIAMRGAEDWVTKGASAQTRGLVGPRLCGSSRFCAVARQLCEVDHMGKHEDQVAKPLKLEAQLFGDPAYKSCPTRLHTEFIFWVQFTSVKQTCLCSFQEGVWGEASGMGVNIKQMLPNKCCYGKDDNDISLGRQLLSVQEGVHGETFGAL